MRIGIDFDNTIVNYDHAFIKKAREWGYLADQRISDKQSLKNHLFTREGGELYWQRLQGYVYGKGIADARLNEGFVEFTKHCQLKQIPIYIVSHKTVYGHYDDDRVNLRVAATEWMEDQGFFSKDGLQLSSANLYFEATRDLKIKRIKMLDCTHFIDDLAEVLLDPEFPDQIQRFLYAPTVTNHSHDSLRVCQDWREAQTSIFSCY